MVLTVAVFRLLLGLITAAMVELKVRVKRKTRKTEKVRRFIVIEVMFG